jgi:TPR repeat protein
MLILRRLSLGLIALSSLPLYVACGGTPGEAVRPKDPTFAGSGRGQTTKCTKVPDDGSPLIVDWDPEARGDLEVAMKQGVAVVHYDCDSIRVLSSCHVDGTYGFVGITTQQQLITLDNADQLAANLPLHGGSIGGSMARGSTLDIGLIMVGKQSTTFYGLDASKLVGHCDGATHFVRSATLGAFAMKTTTAGAVKGAAELFGMGTSGSSTSDRGVENKDGDVAACQSADPDAPKPPSGCGAPLRVQLLAIAASPDAVGKAPDSSSPPKDLSCGPGLVVSEGKCVAAGTTEPHQCDGTDVNDCAAQCAAGDAFSCSWASLSYSLGVSVTKDDAKAAGFDQKGCDNGGASSCLDIGLDYLKGEGVAADAPKGLALVQRSCNAGYGMACDTLGRIYTGQLKSVGVDVGSDVPKAVRYFQRACDGGYGGGCNDLGALYSDGQNTVPDDKPKAAALFQRACDAKDAIGCDRLGTLLQKGDGVPADKARAVTLFQAACDASSSDGCVHLGYMYEKGDGVPVDLDKAKGAYKKACGSTFPSQYACDRVKALGG